MNGSDMIERLATGISGFDQIALGGLPSGRTTLVTGSTGSGKTLFAVEFLARGILRAGEPGVFVTFEETPDDLRRSFRAISGPSSRLRGSIASWPSPSSGPIVVMEGSQSVAAAGSSCHAGRTSGPRAAA